MKPAPLISSFLLFVFFLSPSVSELCNGNDKTALLRIKKSLRNPPSLSSWNPKTDCCTKWTGIECSNKTRINRRVVGLSIREILDVDVKIPVQIGDLPLLQTLDITYTSNLTGTIPYSITKLKNLKSLTIVETQLSGPIPEYISQLKNLKFLDLSINKFTGSVPKSLSLMPKLDRLDLSANQLSGTLPKSLSNNKIRVINLSTNKLRGDASMLFGLNKTTEVVHLWGNNFEFDFSNVKIQRSLYSLFLDQNRIYGKLPNDLTKLQKLGEFDVSHNRLCGKIPLGGKLQLFRSPSFEHNRCLCGLPLDKRC